VDFVTSSLDTQTVWQETFSHKLLYNREEHATAIYFTTYQNSKRVTVLRNTN